MGRPIDTDIVLDRETNPFGENFVQSSFVIDICSIKWPSYETFSMLLQFHSNLLDALDECHVIVGDWLGCGKLLQIVVYYLRIWSQQLAGAKFMLNTEYWGGKEGRHVLQRQATIKSNSK